MAVRLAALALGALTVTVAALPAAAQDSAVDAWPTTSSASPPQPPGSETASPSPQRQSVTGQSMAAPASNAASATTQSSTGLCTIMRDTTMVEQQNCKAIANAVPANGTSEDSFASSTTYVWPSGNRTIVGGTEEDFSVNGNLAAPFPDQRLGLCLKVEKTGNTFCYRDGVRARPSASPVAAAAPPAPKTQSAAPPVPKVIDISKSDGGASAIAGTSIAAPVAVAPVVSAGGSSASSQLAEETRLRKAAEEEVVALKAEVARLSEADQKRVAEVAELRKASEAEESRRLEETQKKAEGDKARMAGVLTLIDELGKRCAARDGEACEQAVQLAREASVTGSLEKIDVEKLEQLRRIATAPFGVEALADFSDIPPSTWAASLVATLLGLTLLVTTLRRGRPSSNLPMPDLPEFEPAAVPSLDPFGPPSFDSQALAASSSSGAHSDIAFPPVTSDARLRATPPPIPSLSGLSSLSVGKHG
ncbi:MAG: hypothetical protein ACT4N2_05550 [Hyphomicrobium sp.]